MSGVPEEHIEAAAEAMWLEEREGTWEQAGDDQRKRYKALAAAALAALQVKAEWTVGMKDWCGEEGGFDLDSDIYDNFKDAAEEVPYWQERGWDGDRSFVVSRLVSGWVRVEGEQP